MPRLRDGASIIDRPAVSTSPWTVRPPPVGTYQTHTSSRHCTSAARLRSRRPSDDMLGPLARPCPWCLQQSAARDRGWARAPSISLRVCAQPSATSGRCRSTRWTMYVGDGRRHGLLHDLRASSPCASAMLAAPPALAAGHAAACPTGHGLTDPVPSLAAHRVPRAERGARVDQQHARKL